MKFGSVRVSCIVTPCQGAEALKQSPSMKQAPKEAGEGQRGTHMGYINAVVPVSNHVIHWSARQERASLAYGTFICCHLQNHGTSGV